MLVDLTHLLDEQTCAWRGGCGYHPETKLDYKKDQPLSFKVNQIKMHAGIGTHIDMPAHCDPSGRSLDEMHLNEMICPLCVVDLSTRCHPDLLVTSKDLETYEKAYQTIPPKALVLIMTGWEQYWHQPKRYHNDYRFPSCDLSVAEMLVERDVTALGIDTLSPDRPDSGFPVHEKLLKSDKLIIENVANGLLMPTHGAYAIIAPAKLKGLTEGPIRLLGITDLDFSALLTECQEG